ncbi:MAG: glucose-1-phosphate adenylyltransferase subunit GlgD [Chloroflexi bacterium]|nr:glucose-1-phosphate adenylyltransferase subunit GlgD [Chloroflexota bacterium]OJV92549.1 MAG: glucose-1-phosphate adenylyltransferase subunit GlgD [Chloroflexi bacterium 54-19]
MTNLDQEVVTFILAGGQGRLNAITAERTVASVPFAGKYRVIDFTLSNCVNSGLFNIEVLTQYRPLSLHDHIRNGKPWGLDRLRGGVRLVSPYVGRQNKGWDRGTADALYQNMNDLLELQAATKTVLILGGDHVYKMDYGPMLEQHQATGADLTVGVVRMPVVQARRYGIVTVDDNKRVTDFVEKPEHAESNLVSMGIYVFRKEVLLERLIDDADDPESRHEFGGDVLPKMIAKGDKVLAYTFEGYWRDVGTLESYWQANMELLNENQGLQIYDRSWTIFTRSEERPPAVLGQDAKVDRSVISHGCQIKGQVVNSILSPGVVVEEGALVKDSIVMVDTVIGKNAVVNRSILDKAILVGENAVVGAEASDGKSALTIVGKRAVLPEGIKVGAGSKIGPGVAITDFDSLELAPGSEVEGKVLL